MSQSRIRHRWTFLSAELDQCEHCQNVRKIHARPLKGSGIKFTRSYLYQVNDEWVDKAPECKTKTDNNGV